jgi:hypothetical protein
MGPSHDQIELPSTMNRNIWREFREQEQFVCKLLLICQTVHFWTSHILQTVKCRHVSGYQLHSVKFMQSQCKHAGSTFGLYHCWARCCHSISVVRGSKTLQDVSTIWRKLHYTKEGEPMCGKVPKFQKKCGQCRLLRPYNHSTNGKQWWMS